MLGSFAYQRIHKKLYIVHMIILATNYQASSKLELVGALNSGQQTSSNIIANFQIAFNETLHVHYKLLSHWLQNWRDMTMEEQEQPLLSKIKKAKSLW